MINELVILADELDKLGERKAADIVDQLVKSAAEPAEEFIEEDTQPLTPLTPEVDEPENEFEDQPKTQVDFHSTTGPGLVARLMKFFKDNPKPAEWSPEDRVKAIEAMQLLISPPQTPQRRNTDNPGA